MDKSPFPPPVREPKLMDLTPYTLEIDPTQQEGPIAWSQLFGNDHPVELEVGSGKGLFLANAATRQTGHNFLGIELSNKYATKAAERVAKRGLANVRVYAGDAKRFLARFVPPTSLRAVHVYFPDPWWKTRHKKRRVFNEALLADAARGLIPGGDLWIATDVAEYAGVIRALVAADPRFQEQPPPEPTTPEHEHDYLTNFERKYRIEGRPIHRAHYRFLPGEG